MNCEKEIYRFKSKKEYMKARNYYQIKIMLILSTAFSFMIVGFLVMLGCCNLDNLSKVPFSNNFVWGILLLLNALAVVKLAPNKRRFEKSVCHDCSLFSTKYCPFNTVQCDYKTRTFLLRYKGKEYDTYDK